MSWNDDNVARLRELWDQGLPTAQIGKLLGFTKNAVVGKAHRIGLERRPSPIRRTAVKPDRKKARSPVMPKLNFEQLDEQTGDNFKENTISIYEKRSSGHQGTNLLSPIGKRGCEWPEGHPDEAEFHFCGKERFEDKPYCLDHCSIAYIIPEKEEIDKQQVSSKIK